MPSDKPPRPRRAIDDHRARVAACLLEAPNARQELLTAEVNLARAPHDEEMAELQLLAATGRLTAESLGLHAPRYDPREHYDATRDRWQGLTPAP